MVNFGKALEAVKVGRKISRSGWNGKGMFLFIVPADAWVSSVIPKGVDELETSRFICMKTADNKLVPWLASQSDVLAEDWVIHE